MSAGGAMIMSVFAAIWWCVGLRSAGFGSPVIYGVAIAVTSVILIPDAPISDTSSDFVALTD